MKRLLSLGLLLSMFAPPLGLLTFCTALAGSARGASALVTDAKRNLDRARTELRKAQQASDKTQAELRRAETAHASPSNTFQQASQSGAAVHSHKLGLPAAAEEAKAAGEEAERVRRARLSGLREQPDYQAATRQAAKAGEELGKLNDDKSITPSQYEEHSAALSAIVRRPLEVQRLELAKDSAYQAAARRSQAAAQRLAQLEQQYQKAFAADPAVVKAREDLKKADKALESARQHDAESARRLSTAQANVNVAQSAYDQAVAQSHHKHR
jgi:hypothetical protein